MMNGGVKQRPLQTRVTKWSLFFSYFNFMDMVDQSAESGLSQDPGRACCVWVTWPEPLSLLLPALTG